MRILHIPSSNRGGAKAPAARLPHRENLIRELRTSGDLPKGKSTRGLGISELLGLRKPGPICAVPPKMELAATG